MTIAIIDYGSGNLHSIAKAFEHMAGEKKVEVTSDPALLAEASHIVLPGVGAFGDCMAGLAALDGMVDALSEQVLEQEKPFLGVCVGMQLLAETGTEHGQHKGLGWIKGQVCPITPSDPALKIPHMGWNALDIKQGHALFDGIDSGDHVYFVHSYHMVVDEDVVLATVEYGGSITAAVAKGNIMGTQFHPEKSQQIGLKLIENFLEMA